MDRPASFLLKLLYALIVLGTALMVGFSSSGWMMISARASPAALILALGPLLFLAIALHRVYRVARFRGTLDAPPMAGLAAALRSIGVALIYLGALAGLLSFASKPLMQMMMKGQSHAGIAFALIGIWLTVAAGLGLLGVLVFEYSRLLAFETQRGAGAVEERPPIPAAMCVLYGARLGEKRRSRLMREILAGPSSGSSAAASACRGARQSRS